MDADKNEIKMEKGVSGEERYQEIRQCFGRNEGHADSRVHIAADAEVEDGKDEIGHQNIKHALFIELLEQVQGQFAVVISIEKNKAA